MLDRVRAVIEGDKQKTNFRSFFVYVDHRRFAWNCLIKELELWWELKEAILAY